MNLIGHLYKQKLIGSKIIHACCAFLLNPDIRTEEYMEALCKLMAVAGKQLEEEHREGRRFSGYLDAYFTRIKENADDPTMDFRVRCLLKVGAG